VPPASDVTTTEALDDAFIGVSLGRRIRAVRTEKKLSMRALAAAADISQPFLSQIEGGRTMPSILTLFKLAKVLDLSPSELLPTAEETDPIRVIRHGEGEFVRVTEGDDGAISRVISSAATQDATVQEYRITTVPYRGEWFESDGQNTIYLVAGGITVTIEDRGSWTLGPGDALSHPGALRNRWSIDSGDGATLLLVNVP
jgi:transcriptional regulator with XRE-family HTH domain